MNAERASHAGAESTTRQRPLVTHTDRAARAMKKHWGRRTAERHRRAWGAVLVFVFVHPTGPDRATQTQSGVDDDTRPLNTLYHPSSPTCFQRVSCGPSRADAGRWARLGAVQVACGRGTRPAAGDCAASNSITLCAVHVAGIAFIWPSPSAQSKFGCPT